MNNLDDWKTNVASTFGELGQIYTELAVIRSRAYEASSIAGRFLDAREMEDLGRIAAIADRLIGRTMVLSDQAKAALMSNPRE